jgi:3-dehydroquinate synthase
MRAAVYLAQKTGYLSAEDSLDILDAIARYGPIPAPDGILPERLLARLASDKKTVQGQVHFVLPERIGQVKVVSGIDSDLVLAAIRDALE